MIRVRITRSSSISLILSLMCMISILFSISISLHIRATICIWLTCINMITRVTSSNISFGLRYSTNIDLSIRTRVRIERMTRSICMIRCGIIVGSILLFVNIHIVNTNSRMRIRIRITIRNRLTINIILIARIKS